MKRSQPASSLYSMQGDFSLDSLFAASKSKTRIDLWTQFIRDAGVRKMVEIGVYRGDLAAEILEACPGVRSYYMLDPWKHLEAWNKPANTEDEVFESYYRETMAKTDFAQDRRIVLRGKTTEVVDEIADDELDLAYIDGDHTLKGISIDLIRVYPKVREGGYIGGDDFSRSIWQHKRKFEPTLVFPFAVYFAEAVGATIYALPNSQFCMQKTRGGFSFVDLTGTYDDLGLKSQISPRKRILNVLGLA